MKTRLNIIYLLYVLYHFGFSQSGITVSVYLYAPGLSADSSVYITGNIEQLGLWYPDRVKMDCLGSDTWTKTIPLQQPTVIEYKYTLGSWQDEGADAHGRPLSNFTARVAGDTVISDTVLYWTPERQRQREPTIKGIVKKHSGFKTEGLLPRDILVWLPPGYENDSTKQYPVLYMHDGQNVFDAATSSFGNEWRIDESCDSLIHAGKIPPLIVVAVNNTSNRTSEYTPGEKATGYMNFVVNTLKPFIDSTYRTITSPQNTIVGGSSAGGIISFMLVWEYPHVFSKAICMSPALKIKEIDYVKVVKAGDNHPKVFFYFYNGGIDLEKKLQPGIDEMISVLKEKSYQAGRDFEIYIDPNALHNEQAWARHFPQAIQACFNSIK